VCSSGGGPNGSFPVGKFASLSVLGNATCSDGSSALYTGVLNGNVCVLDGGFTQVGYLDCGAGGSAPQSCVTEGGECAPGASSHAPCNGTSTCSVLPPPPPTVGGPWPMMYHDAAHTNTAAAAGPTSPAILWKYGLALPYGVVVASDVRALAEDVVIATTDWQDRSNPPPSGGVNAITFDGKPAFQWINADGGYMDCAPSIGADGTIYLGETNEHALAQNASLLWTVPLNADGPYASSSALGPDGTIFFVTSSFQNPPVAFAYAISPGGVVRWSHATGPLPDNVHAPPAVSRDGATVYFFWGAALHALSALDGTQLWSADVPGGGECVPSVGADATIYCGSVAYSSAGALQWAVPVGADVSSTFLAPAADGRLYGLSADGNNVFCLLPQIGSIAWAVPMPLGDTATAFVLDGGASMFVRVGASVIALERASGVQLWSIDLPGADASQAVAGFAVMSDGTLLFETTGQDAWIYAIGNAGR
jgi:outer membrane protein assembly factor BamB